MTSFYDVTNSSRIPRCMVISDTLMTITSQKLLQLTLNFHWSKIWGRVKFEENLETIQCHDVILWRHEIFQHTTIIRLFGLYWQLLLYRQLLLLRKVHQTSKFSYHISFNSNNVEKTRNGSEIAYNYFGFRAGYIQVTVRLHNNKEEIKRNFYRLHTLHRLQLLLR